MKKYKEQAEINVEVKGGLLNSENTTQSSVVFPAELQHF